MLSPPRRRGTTSVRMPDSPAGGRGSELRFETYSRCVWVGVTSLIDEIKGESPREHASLTALPQGDVTTVGDVQIGHCRGSRVPALGWPHRIED